MSDLSELTGNDYVSLPFITAGGGVDAVNVVHGALAGLIEWSGAAAERPLFKPALSIDGGRVALDGPWRRLDRWIPTSTTNLADGTTIVLTICAPTGYPAARGFFIRIEVESKARRPVEVVASMEVCWQWTRHIIATARPVGTVHQLATVDGVLLLHAGPGMMPALAVAGLHDQQIELGGTTSAANGEVLTARIEQRFTAAPQRRTVACFYVGAGREADGALSAAKGMVRTGSERWLRQARMELSHTLRAGHDQRWSDLLNRNLLFNRYYALGRAVDDDRLYLLRSRSPRCEAPGVLNEREALFWTLPALIMADNGLAREALLRMLELHSERSGEFLRYIDGGAFDAAFALDQLLFYPWIIDRYVQLTEDASLLEEPLVRQVLFEADSALFMRLHPQHMLGSTELLPSGDAADHPWTTWGNVLLWAWCDALPRIWPASSETPQPQFESAAAEVIAAIHQHLVTEVDGAPVFASSASLEGDAAVYDDPLGSLALMPVIGFCADDDPVWVATMEFLRSPRYPLWRDGKVPGLAGRAEPRRAQLAALCADLLGPDSEGALERLRRLSLPRSLAAPAWDPDSGEAHGADHAALAGFLAWSLAVAAEARADTGRRRRAAR